MGQTKARTLESFVYQVLTTRAILASIVIALIVGAGVYMLRRNVVTSDVVGMELERFAKLRAQLQAEMSAYGGGAQGVLTQLRLVESTKAHSDLVLARVRGTAKRTVGDAQGPDSALMLSASNLIESSDPAEGELMGVRYAVIELDGRRCLHSLATIVAPAGHESSEVEAVFLLSAAGTNQMRANALVAGSLAAIVAFIAALLLYGVILALTRRLSVLASALLDSNIELAKVLGGVIAKRDSDSDAHNFRVTIYAVRLAEAARLSDFAIQALIKGAFLHDVGKIAVRDEVLLKPAKLDTGEFEHVKTHVDHGLDIVSRSRWLRDAARVVGDHHEKYDGTGYPKGIAGQDIPIEARVFAIVDVFDALTNKRPHKDPLPLEEAIEILRQGRGTHFDPIRLDYFLEVAPPLYERLAGHEDDSVRDELKEIVETYFTRGVRTLAF
jgi:HD-GYP domain-containing protein (c-di-GMP phosphodiesterase class II)